MGRRKLAEFKYCGRCKQTLPAKENFTRRKNAKDGFEYGCKKCKGYTGKIIHKQGKLLLCLKCKVYKDKKEFYDNSKKTHRNGKDLRCKLCKYEQYLKRKENDGNVQNLDRLLADRFDAVNLRAKRKNEVLIFDVSYLKELWNKQNGKCAISGIEMTYIMFKGRIPTNISVDRMDSKIGYTKENIQLVCMAVNQMKSDLTIEKLLYFCNEILKNYEKK